MQTHRLCLAQNWAPAATYTVVYVWHSLEDFCGSLAVYLPLNGTKEQLEQGAS